MTEIEIVNDWLRLIDPKTMQGQVESYKAVTDAAMYIIFHEKNPPTKAIDRDANNLYQMTVLKCLTVLKLVESKLNYVNDIDKTKMSVYDPFGLKPVIRAQYEAYGHFNNLYIQSKSPEEKQLKYDIWVMCGLLNRQQFDAIQPETIKKKAQEKLEIDELEKEIKNNPVYKSFDGKTQQKVFNRAQHRSDWKLVVNGNLGDYVGWQQLVDNAGANPYMKNLYKNFSLGAHPSHVSVFQFRDAYAKGMEAADFFTEMNLKLSKFFISCLIADYCKVSAEAKKVFDTLPDLHQLLINSYNRMTRSDQFLVNNIWDKYENIQPTNPPK